MRAKLAIAVFIGILSFASLALLGQIAPAATGTDFEISLIGGILMGVGSYLVLARPSHRRRTTASIVLGLILAAVLYLGFNSQLIAALETGLIGAVLTYLIYPIVTGGRKLWLKLLTITVAAAILVAAFAVLDPVTITYTPGRVDATGVSPYNADPIPIPFCTYVYPYVGLPITFNIETGDIVNFQFQYNLQGYKTSLPWDNKKADVIAEFGWKQAFGGWSGSSGPSFGARQSLSVNALSGVDSGLQFGGFHTYTKSGTVQLPSFSFSSAGEYYYMLDFVGRSDYYKETAGGLTPSYYYVGSHYCASPIPKLIKVTFHVTVPANLLGGGTSGGGGGGAGGTGKFT